MSRMTSGAMSGSATTSPRRSAITPSATTPLALVRKQRAAMMRSTGRSLPEEGAGALVLADGMGTQGVEDREASRREQGQQPSDQRGTEASGDRGQDLAGLRHQGWSRQVARARGCC